MVQADSFNRSRIQTVLAVVLTTNLARADAPGNVYLAREETGLPKDSVANVSQIVTADRRPPIPHGEGLGAPGAQARRGRLGPPSRPRHRELLLSHDQKVGGKKVPAIFPGAASSYGATDTLLNQTDGGSRITRSCKVQDNSA